MREMIVVCVGQAGIQMSSAVWELLCLEHGITPDGSFTSKEAEESTENIDGLNTFFFPSIYGNRVPRCTMIDLEPTVVDEIRSGCYRDLFHPEELISSCEDAANVFARGFYSAGKAIQAHCQERIRKMTERCDHLRGIILLSSYGGGTGSGLGCILTEYLNIMHSKIALTHVTVYPGQKLTTSTVEPYNAVHALRYSVEYADMSLMFDNESMYNICSKALALTRPSYHHLNRLTAQIYSGITASLRYVSALDSNIDHHLTNGVPYPRLHFMLSAGAPFLTSQTASKEKLSVVDLTADVFDMGNQLMTCDLNSGKYMSCMLQYRGDISCTDIYGCLMRIKAGKLGTKSDFVDWCPTGFKVGLTGTPATWVPASHQVSARRSLTMLCNHSGITAGWRALSAKFDALFHKKAFVHWYVGEGMEESEFQDAREELEAIVQDYECTNEGGEGGPAVRKSPKAEDNKVEDENPPQEEMENEQDHEANEENLGEQNELEYVPEEESAVPRESEQQMSFEANDVNEPEPEPAEPNESEDQYNSSQSQEIEMLNEDESSSDNEDK